MKVVVPMAGRGSRFANKGFATPKPLISVAGKPMLFWALQSLESLVYQDLILIILREHEEAFHVVDQVKSWLPEKSIHAVLLEDVTEGQLCTVLAAEQHLDESPVLIAASDTYIPTQLGTWLAQYPSDTKGVISTINLPGERWSFAKTEKNSHLVKEVAEKHRISDHCSTGLYYFSSGKVLKSRGEAMIQNQETTKGEYYVIPVYQKMIEAGEPVYIAPEKEMWDMGTPEAKATFEEHLQTR